MQISSGIPTLEELKSLGIQRDPAPQKSQSTATQESKPEIETAPDLPPKPPEDVRYKTGNKEEYWLDSDDYKPDNGYQKLAFEDPVDMLLFFDEALNKQKGHLHGWQVEIGELLGQVKPTAKEPFKYCLCAANGSGKDLFVIAPFAIWFACTKIRSLVVITSASGQQLTGQTENHIKNLAEKINHWFVSNGQSPIFRIKQRFIKCLLSGSQIRLFVTDEAGKAEGYHPIDIDTEMAIIENEAKSIPEDIDAAICRCTGFSYFLKVSTPGEPIGHFHYAFLNWKNKRHISAFQCDHLSLSEIEEDKIKYGESSYIYRSKVLALFTPLGSTVVISGESLEKCKKRKTPALFQNWPIRVGIDLAIGGDEIVITGWRGNKRVFQHTFREADTTITADIIDRYLTSKGISKDHEYIRADDGGVGHGIIDQLVKKKWNIKRVLNQWAARNKREFRNRGAEMWFQFGRLIDECILQIPEEDKELEAQLTTRYYKKSDVNGTLLLQSKAEAKSEGRPSPDRADATVLAFSDLTIMDFLGEVQATDSKKPDPNITYGDHIVSIERLTKAQANPDFDYFNPDSHKQRSTYGDPYAALDEQLNKQLKSSGETNAGNKRRIYGSLSAIFSTK